MPIHCLLENSHDLKNSTKSQYVTIYRIVRLNWTSANLGDNFQSSRNALFTAFETLFEFRIRYKYKRLTVHKTFSIYGDYVGKC